MVPLEFGSDIGGSIRVPSSIRGVYGHKPSFDLVPQRGHVPPGLDGASPPFNVVGPMARTASDLTVGLDVLAGPAGDEAKAYRLDLPAARHARLGDFRVLVIDTHPIAKADKEIIAAIGALASRLEQVERQGRSGSAT